VDIVKMDISTILRMGKLVTLTSQVVQSVSQVVRNVVMKKPVKNAMEITISMTI
jgi:hypothetical protein